MDDDTFCGECGAKVVVETCPKCGEIARPGKKFCSKCGFKLIDGDEISEPEDSDIPITGQMSTVDIPFDLIEKNILLEAARQVRDTKEEQLNKADKYDEYEDYEEYDNDEYDEEEYDEDEYDEDEYDEYESEDETINDYEEYDDEEEEKSLSSRLITASMIILGLIIVLIIAFLFFNNRNEKEEIEETPVVEEVENNEEEETENTHTYVTIVDDVNIRDYPSTENSNKIGVARVGEKYEFLGYASESSKWIMIKIDDSTNGYVYGDYVKIEE